MTKLRLDSDELRIVGHAINWQLNVPYHRASTPKLNEDEKETLSALFRGLCDLNRFCLVQKCFAHIETGERLVSEDGRLTIPAWHLRLMTDALASFQRELASSPAEIEIVTGSPPAKARDVLSRLLACLEST